MNPLVSRRHFLGRASAGAGLLILSGTRGFGKISPNEKLNIGVIGVAGRGGDDLAEVGTENIVALCDIDDHNRAAAAKKYPGAKTCNDFRQLIDQKDLDAVVVGTPDHAHAVQAVAALRSGRHLYCEKPLARTVSEARIITDTARKMRKVTQLGTQIHAGGNYRRVVELVKSGAIGKVAEVHVWVNSSYGGKERPTGTAPVPPHIHYDLWLGPVPERPYSPEYLPFHWRDWWAFGGGSLADFGCHFMDLPFWALDLKYPRAVEVVDGPPVHPESTPPWLIVRYEFPAREDPPPGARQPPVKLTWYHGGKHPALLTDEQYAKWKGGVLFMGEKGMLIADYNRRALWPEKDFEAFKPPEKSIPDSVGHHKEWINAIKNGGPTTCHFDYSGPLSEAALLGNVAFRAGKRLEWDPQKLRAKNCPEADQFLQHHYRPGWKL